MSKTKRITVLTILVALCYYTVAYWSYSFRHPELTDTQRLIHSWEVLTWR